MTFVEREALLSNILAEDARYYGLANAGFNLTLPNYQQSEFQSSFDNNNYSNIKKANISVE